jgi:hypothetical protein
MWSCLVIYGGRGARLGAEAVLRQQVAEDLDGGDRAEDCGGGRVARAADDQRDGQQARARP